MENENQLETFVEKLTMVKDDYIKSKQELAVSIRKDVVAVELKNILKTTSDLDLRNAISKYVDDLFKMYSK